MPDQPRLTIMRVAIWLIFVNATTALVAHRLHDWRRWLLCGGVLLVSLICMAALVIFRNRGRRP